MLYHNCLFFLQLIWGVNSVTDFKSLCKKELEFCLSNEWCKNSGRCRAFGNAFRGCVIKCACLPDYSGNNCELPSIAAKRNKTHSKYTTCNPGTTSASRCYNGVCTDNLRLPCKCNEGWYNRECSARMMAERPKVKMCQTRDNKYDPCVHGICTGNPLLPCKCNPGWFKRDCSSKCNLLCLNNGKCEIVNGTPLCRCTTPYTGPLCELQESEKTKCFGVDCWKGKCVKVKKHLYPRCECFNGWTGMFCNKTCTVHCYNGGSRFYDYDNKIEECMCVDGFTGTQCLTKAIKNERNFIYGDHGEYLYIAIALPTAMFCLLGIFVLIILCIRLRNRRRLNEIASPALTSPIYKGNILNTGLEPGEMKLLQKPSSLEVNPAVYPKYILPAYREF